VHVLDRLGQRTIGPVLRSALADATELARRLHDAPPFTDVMADWFLDIHILARLHRPDRRQRVPMVRRRNEHRGDRLVVENPAQILNRLRPRTTLARNIRSKLGGPIAVRVTDVSDLTVGEPRQFARVLFAADAASDDGHGNLVIGAHSALLGRADRRRKRCGRHGCRGQNGVFEKSTASDGVHRFSMAITQWVVQLR
jgi:hypothetical protein